MSAQMTDDDISRITSELTTYLETHPLTFGDNGEMTDEGWEHWNEFVYQRLERYSNGYVNFN